MDDDFDDDDDEELKPLKAKRKIGRKEVTTRKRKSKVIWRTGKLADDDENVEPGSRAHEAEKRLRFEKKKSMKKERWSAGGLWRI